ncbi:hypothetical protein FDP41_004157 [Naegleria fowleri]|uniref:Purple acid phosphatase n=1 Tax=Naegleria fowleri TaxID=5763 RepID=A0A6A5BPW9_NAEFO|nr:uncharacterized protein FDP41_004157 [Naegleria fowleri]KAF0976862.1 hypothetical protein FDP41_004157 [Naegleria fowleri]
MKLSAVTTTLLALLVVVCYCCGTNLVRHVVVEGFPIAAAKHLHRSSNNNNIRITSSIKGSVGSNLDDENEYKPIEVHLAFTSTPNQMVVTFHTINYDENKLGKPIVKYSSKDASLKRDFQVAHLGNVVTQYGQVSQTGFDMSILLSNLEYSTKYYYQCGFMLNDNVTSDIYYFHTRSDPRTSESLETTIVMYGDQGTTNSKHVIAQVGEFVKNFNGTNMFVYHLGDISYADDFPGLIYQAIWTKYMIMMEQIMPYTSYMVLPGNHEKGPKLEPYHKFELGFMAYNHRFFMPLRNTSQYGHNMWYSFEHGPITFVSISTETNYPNAFYSEYNFKGDQLAWLEHTLSSIDRKKTPWVIVVGHRPVYSSKHGFSTADGQVSGESLRIQSAFEDIIVKYHVDIMMVGHVHSYERTYPVYKTQVERKNNFHNLRYPIHIVNGAGGCIEGVTHEWYIHFGHDWSANIFYKDEGYGILRTSYSRQTRVHSLHFDFHAAKTNEIVDTVTITKDAQ